MRSRTIKNRRKRSIYKNIKNIIEALTFEVQQNRTFLSVNKQIKYHTKAGSNYDLNFVNKTLKND